MKNKKVIVVAAVTAAAVFALTTLFYLSPAGKLVYSGFAQLSKDGGTAKLLKIESLIDANYMGTFSKEYMTDRAAESYAAAVGDKYTCYLDTENFKNMQESLGGGYSGVGIHVEAKDGKIRVASVMENSPAQAAGLLADDYIVSVNGNAYDADTLSEAISIIKSTPKGESVELGIERGGMISNMKVTVGDVEIEYVTSKLLEANIGYVRIDTFGNDAHKSFETEVNSLIDGGAASLIIDLRNNPGGSLDTVVEMVDFLVPEGTITTVKDKNGNEEKYTSDASEINLPMCVLINESSASASEIMAAALRDFDKATLVGKNTYGKGVVQGVFDLGDGTGLRVTVAKYFTPSGESIDGKGVAPDVEIDLPDGVVIENYNAETPGDTQLEKAIEILKK